MLTTIHLYADERRRVWSLAGLLFGTAYAGLLGALYFIQIGVLLPALRRGDWQGMDQFAFAEFLITWVTCYTYIPFNVQATAAIQWHSCARRG
jgi:hypothetical protein